MSKPSAELELLSRLQDGQWHYGLELVRKSEASRGRLKRLFIYLQLSDLEDQGLVVSTRVEELDVVPEEPTGTRSQAEIQALAMTYGVQLTGRRVYKITPRGRTALLRGEL